MKKVLGYISVLGEGWKSSLPTNINKNEGR